MRYIPRHTGKGLLSSALLACAGCQTLVAPPPPSLIPVDSHRLGSGDVEAAAGFNKSLLTAAASRGISGLFLDSPVTSLHFGLPRDFDLALRANFWGSQGSMALQLAHPFFTRDRWAWDWVSGVGASYNSGRRTFCSDFESPPTNCPAQVVQERFAYFSAAPFGGMRGNVQILDWLTLNAQVRGSLSLSFHGTGMEEISNEQRFWIEGALGLVFRPLQRLRLGISGHFSTGVANVPGTQFMSAFVLPSVAGSASLEF